MVTKKAVEDILQTIPDPELGVSIWDLGLIYDVKIDKKMHEITIIMTLTTVGCPLFSLMEGPIKQEIGALPGVKAVHIDLTFDPPWNPDKMSEAAKLQLGFV